MSMQLLDPLLQQFQLKNMTLRNRVVSTSHEPSYTEDGMPKAALPPLPRGEGQGRHRPDDDGRLRGGRPRQPGRLRQPARLQGRDRAVAARAGLRGARERRGGDVPDHPSWSAHEQLRRRLASRHRAVGDPGARAPRLPEGRRGMGYGPHREGIRRRDGQMPGGGSRRHRARGLHPPARLVLVAADQSPRRRVRDGQPRGPTSVPAAGDPGRARSGGARLRRRYPDVARRGHRRRPEVRRRRRDRQAGGGRGHRLHQRHQGLHGQRRGAVAGDPADGHAGRASPRVRGPGQGRPCRSRSCTPPGSTTWRPRATRSATG